MKTNAGFCQILKPILVFLSTKNDDVKRRMAHDTCLRAHHLMTRVHVSVCLGNFE